MGRKQDEILTPPRIGKTNPGPNCRYCWACGEWSHEAVWGLAREDDEWYSVCPLCGEYEHIGTGPFD